MLKGAVIGGFLATACTPETAPVGLDTAAVEAADPTEPVDDGPAELSAPVPSWTAEELAAEVSTAFEGGLPDPFLPRDLYVSMFDHADEDCPTSELPYHLPGDYEGCSTEDGTFFFGHGEYQQDVDAEALESFYLLGDFYILDPLSQRFDGAGEVLYSVVPGTGSVDVRFELLISGTWGYPGTEGWMSEGMSLALWTYGVWDHGEAIGTLDGSVQLGDLPLFMDDLSFDPGNCEDRPIRGQLRVRDPKGAWYTLDFGGECTGCAEVIWADGSSLGEACLDLHDTPAALLNRLATADGLVDPEQL